MPIDPVENVIQKQKCATCGKPIAQGKVRVQFRIAKLVCRACFGQAPIKTQDTVLTT